MHRTSRIPGGRWPSPQTRQRRNFCLPSRHSSATSSRAASSHGWSPSSRPFLDSPPAFGGSITVQPSMALHLSSPDTSSDSVLMRRSSSWSSSHTRRSGSRFAIFSSSLNTRSLRSRSCSCGLSGKSSSNSSGGWNASRSPVISATSSRHATWVSGGSRSVRPCSQSDTGGRPGSFPRTVVSAQASNRMSVAGRITGSGVKAALRCSGESSLSFLPIFAGLAERPARSFASFSSCRLRRIASVCRQASP